MGVLTTTVARARARLSLNTLLLALALIYALFAGLRTVGDPDLGWQIATGRWIVQHLQIPSTDVLSYTGAGRPWTYPALSQILLYWFHGIGGYRLLSWLAALGCVAATFILGRGNGVRAVLAALAVPIMASRIDPRAEMFTEILFAAFVSLLWSYHRSGHARLWLLPLLMLLWTNLHPGFISGLTMCGAYVLLELVDGSCDRIEPGAARRLRAAAPFLGTTLLATFFNPWGPAVYSAVYRQSQILKIHRSWVVEWRSIRLTPLKVVSEAFDWRDPNSALWWLLAIAIVAVVIAIVRRRPAAAAILAVAAYVTLDSRRMRGPFATLLVIIGGSIIHDSLKSESLESARRWFAARVPLRPLFAAAGVCLLAAFISVRAADLVGNRYYLRGTSRFSVFGAGESAWYPEEAAGFMVAQKLPANLFNDFTVGGFLTQELSPEIYRDYIDGRSLPFSGEQFYRSFQLLGKPFDSSEWRQEAESRDIRTVFLSLHRGIWGGLSNLATFCGSRGWRPVYLDPYAAIFVRELPETAELTARLGKDCDSIAFAPDPPPSRDRTSAQRFDYHLNSAAVLMSLGRHAEASAQLRSAEAIFPGSAFLHYAKGVMLGFAGDLDGAEKELRLSLELEPSSETAYALGKLLQNEGRWGDAERLVRRHIEVAEDPAPMYVELGNIQVAQGRPGDALQSFAQAEKLTIFRAGAEVLGSGFYARLHAGRARAWWKLGDVQRATQSVRVALSFAPSNPELVKSLADLSSAASGRTEPVPAQKQSQVNTEGPRP